ncbi:MAG: hypothetical protein NVV59_04595 [Chitinophagaceae bacterium]|nr:hypothetical protein [Chitinophagaceae bacterium]
MPDQLDEQLSLQEQFEALLQKDDKLQIRDFLNHQNIADVADLVYEFPEFESQIVANMSVHRSASVFKILEFPTQKRDYTNATTQYHRILAQRTSCR